MSSVMSGIIDSQPNNIVSLFSIINCLSGITVSIYGSVNSLPDYLNYLSI